ncbi:MAG: FAD-dependent oxidoreductase [Pseudomonadota bacterium]|nr:FAD-dependent oxidoreductase [Pseudomonadota bacterium]
MNDQVLIVGAGPTGLVLALWLTRLGVRVRIIDRADRPGTTSRALAVQARTLELYRQLDLASVVVERGHEVPAVNLWVKRKRAARMPFERIGAGLTPYPFLHIFPQDEHEQLLTERLRGLGVEVMRATELIAFREEGDSISADLRAADGKETPCRADYIVGCDGAHSVVRKTIAAGFPGGTYRQVFYVADVEATGPAMDGELHIDLDEADFLAVFPLAGTNRARLIGTVRDERAARADTLQFGDVSTRAIEHLKLGMRHVNWFSTYHVHHRVAEHFRRGRALLAGDAAHIHSPAGGQGMNTGIGDAINLAWKLAAVVHGQARDALLDSYPLERMAFARKLVATTDRVFSLATAEGGLAAFIRTRVVPLLAPQALSIAWVQEKLFRTVSQIAVNYRGSTLSAGSAGGVHGGDRLPWGGGESDNFVPLHSMAWQVHVYGAASAQLSAWCAGHQVPLHVFAWKDRHGVAGFARDALYLVRPDTYVALADPTAAPDVIESYCASRSISLAAPAAGPS